MVNVMGIKRIYWHLMNPRETLRKILIRLKERVVYPTNNGYCLICESDTSFIEWGHGCGIITNVKNACRFLGNVL